MDTNKVIQSLWIGDTLSIIERLCIQSFLDNGHEFHLYTYRDVKNIPYGTIVMDANNIISSKKVLDNARNSLAGISNWFRYQLLYDKGGWWADTDIICLRPLDIKDDFCFANDLQTSEVRDPIANSIIKSPQQAEYLADLLEYISLNPLILQEEKSRIGTELLNAVLANYDSEKFIHSAELFFPVGWFELYKYVSKQNEIITGQTYTVHLFNSFWRDGALNKNAIYHPDSLYEQLKRKYKINPTNVRANVIDCQE